MSRLRETTEDASAGYEFVTQGDARRAFVFPILRLAIARGFSNYRLFIA